MSFFRFFTLSVFLLALFLPSLPVYAAAEMGDLIKCPDFSSVYYYAQDGQRYAFPNEQVYFSWYENFDGVKTISCEDLASANLAGLVTYQAGTRLVKLQTASTVYVVEPQGLLRPMASEEQAFEFYGEDWAGRVDDLPDVFFSHYDVGASLANEEIPEGMAFISEEGTLWRMQEDGMLADIDEVMASGVGMPVKNLSLEKEAFESRMGISLEAMMPEEQESLELLLADFQTVVTDVVIDGSFSFEEIDGEEVVENDDSATTEEDQTTVEDDSDSLTQEEYDALVEDLESDLEGLDEQTQQVEEISDEAQVLDDTI